METLVHTTTKLLNNGILLNVNVCYVNDLMERMHMMMKRKPVRVRMKRENFGVQHTPCMTSQAS